MTFKNILCYTVAVIGGFFSYFFGGWTMDLEVLVTLMAIDFITGLIVAGVFKKSKKTETGALNSRESFKGLCKKAVTLLFVGMANALDRYLGVEFLRGAVIGGFMVNELISIVENAGLMGITSEPIEKAIDILKKKLEEPKGDDDEH